MKVLKIKYMVLGENGIPVEKVYTTIKPARMNNNSCVKILHKEVGNALYVSHEECEAEIEIKVK